MKTEIADNQLFLKNMSFIKKSVTTLFCAFFAISSYANQENHENQTKSETVENHEASTHEDHTAVAESASHDAKHEGNEGHEGNGKFAPGKMITEHIADAHDWHMWGKGHSAVSIPLPVILYTKSNGLQTFLSSKFEHGHAAYLGFKLNENGHVIWEDETKTEKIYDFSFTKNVLAMVLAVLALSIIVIGMARTYAKRKGKAPQGLHNLIEPLILFIRDDMALPLIGKKADKFMPLLLTIFFFIFMNNIFGLIPIFPGGANVTGNISVTLVLALVVFITVNLNGNKYYWKHIFMPDVPVWMYVIIIPIEILGVILKPFVLMLRLFANITAGHIIILGFFSLIFIFGAMDAKIGYMVSPLSVAFTVFMGMLEMLVAFLQAFVFTLLTVIYIGMAVEEHHH